jgi:adhesin transport system outer membrane protein
VGRGVDLEQAGARLALAESNLTSESANLHDVTARFQRVVGMSPVAGLAFSPLVADGMAATGNDAVAAALATSPAISAAIENLRAARAAASASEGAYQPRVEARVRGGGGHNFEGVVDQRRDAKAEVVLAWNLFNGGADQARVRQGANLLNQAADLRDRVCRDTRQNVSIAYSDVKKLAEQLLALDRNVLAIEKARDAYRQQFDIGQRSLLDLLNSENELYTARRAYADAQFDLSISHGRYLASTQRLTRQLGLNVPLVGPAPEEVPGESADRPERCPPQAVDIQTTPRADLDARAAQLMKLAPPAAKPATPR